MSAEPFGHYLSAIYRHLQMLIAAELAPFRIGSGQYIFLLMITANEGISQKELSEELLIDKTTTAKAVKKLEAEGYVIREVDPADNRYYKIYLTESGKIMIPKVQDVLKKVMNISLNGISDNEHQLLTGLLKKMLLSLNDQVRKSSL
jgi:DNA-binding MarR family transcriptional regulator